MFAEQAHFLDITKIFCNCFVESCLLQYALKAVIHLHSLSYNRHFPSSMTRLNGHSEPRFHNILLLCRGLQMTSKLLINRNNFFNIQHSSKM